MVRSLASITFDSPQLGKQLQQNIKNFIILTQRIFNFDFVEKGLGIVSLSHFVHDFSSKIILMLYPINWSNFIVWLPLLLEILEIFYATPSLFDIYTIHVHWIYFHSATSSPFQVCLSSTISLCNTGLSSTHTDF